jgi:hypothetical protein
MRKLLKTLLHGLVLLPLQAVAAENRWIDSLSASIGEDKNSNQMDVYRIGIQNRWNRTWFNDGAWYLGGYWDGLQRDAEISSGFAPFSEVGVGGHLLSEDVIGKRELGTGFQLASHIGVGLGFGEKGRYELAYRFQHLTNAGIKSPNNGLDLHLLSFGYHFD